MSRWEAQATVRPLDALRSCKKKLANHQQAPNIEEFITGQIDLRAAVDNHESYRGDAAPEEGQF